ncbi:MAG: M48 family metalloprotease [bacterium]
MNSTVESPLTDFTRLLVSLAIALFVAGIVAGCSGQRSSNPHDNWVIFSTEEGEKEQGKYVHKQLRKRDALYRSDTMVNYVNNIGQRIAAYSHRDSLNYHFNIIRSFEINAFAAPGGYIYVTRGILKHVESEQELAGILAHEVGHVAARHHAKRNQLKYAALLSTIALATQTGGRGLSGGMLGGRTVTLAYSRIQEEEADQLGMEYAAKAGYPPSGLIEFLRQLNSVQEEIPIKEMQFFRTHPFISDRINKASIDLNRYRKMMSDTVVRSGYRLQRMKHEYLLSKREQEILNKVNGLIVSYRAKNIGQIRSYLDRDFKLGSGKGKQGMTQFLKDMRKRFQGTDTVTYDYRLLNVDASDTNAAVLYEFESKLYDRNKSAPQVLDGRQLLIWKRDKGEEWKLVRLR